ncbi:MAG TPA: amidohydrolase [Candidatus Limnocylindria bacterium]|nr:amidohydrolase [Candidatus Limnocylindria bacterium]
MTDLDLLITGARLEPMLDGADPRLDALAISSGRISAIGRAAELRPLAGPGTRVISLNGETVLPGFQDAHIHALEAGVELLQCHLADLGSAEAYLAAIAAYAEAHPDEEWVAGGGWSMPDFPGGIPRREALDAILPDRPAFLTSRDGHTAWVNSLALARAGISAASADPVNGRIERDPDGSPVGALQEAAIHLVASLVPPPGPPMLREALRVAQRHLHGLGITTWNEANLHRDPLDAYLAAIEAGELTARVVGSLHWDPDRGVDQIQDLGEQRRTVARAPGNDGLRFRAPGVKFFLDGVMESFTAALLEPYLDQRGAATTNRGMPTYEQPWLDEIVTALDLHGFQVHQHAIGDGAVRMALNAVAAARRSNGPRDARHHVAHLQLIHPDDLPRFAELDVVANMQPFWAVLEDQMTELTIPFLGPIRTTWQYPFRSLQLAGARLAGGSDWPVSTADPLVEMEVAIRRTRPRHRAEPVFLPTERLDLDTALRAFTIGSAWVHRLEADTGTLEPGKLADLAILDRDLRAAPDGTIANARVRMTLVGGQVVFEA